MKAKERIIAALDVDNPDAAHALVEQLKPFVGSFKIGLEFITAMFASIMVPDEALAARNVIKIRELFFLLAGQGFYDGKFDDIPHTVGAASKIVASLGMKMFNVHASAGIPAMVAAAKNAGNSKTLGVTVLTSLSEEDAFLTFGAPSKAKVLQFARQASIAGLTGVICSPQELKLLNSQPELQNFWKVCPGIRSPDDPADDQKRTLSPREAMRAGADMLVIGRPITKHQSPITAATKIADEIRQGLKERFHLALFDSGKIKFGEFRLKLHDTKPEAPLSPIYLNIRDLLECHYALAGDILHDLLPADIGDFDYVMGIPKAGQPIGIEFAKAVGKPHLRIIKEEHEGGRRITATIIDPFKEGGKVILIDDLVTKAGTKREAIKGIEANGLKVVATLVLYDREQGGLRELNESGRPTYAAASLTETLDFFVREKKITAEQGKAVLDYTAAN